MTCDLLTTSRVLCFRGPHKTRITIASNILPPGIILSRNLAVLEHLLKHSYLQWRRNEFESGVGGDSRFGERFHDGQYSLVSFCLLSFYSRWPRACPMESAPVHIYASVWCLL